MPVVYASKSLKPDKEDLIEINNLANLELAELDFSPHDPDSMVLISEWYSSEFSVEYKDNIYEYSDLSILHHIEEIANKKRNKYLLVEKEDTYLSKKGITRLLNRFDDKVRVQDFVKLLNMQILYEMDINHDESNCFWCDYFKNFEKYTFTKSITASDLIFVAMNDLSKQYCKNIPLLYILAKYHKNNTNHKVLKELNKYVPKPLKQIFPKRTIICRTTKLSLEECDNSD